MIRNYIIDGKSNFVFLYSENRISRSNWELESTKAGISTCSPNMVLMIGDT